MLYASARWSRADRSLLRHARTRCPFGGDALQRRRCVMRHDQTSPFRSAASARFDPFSHSLSHTFSLSLSESGPNSCPFPLHGRAVPFDSESCAFSRKTATVPSARKRNKEFRACIPSFWRNNRTILPRHIELIRKRKRPSGLINGRLPWVSARWSRSCSHQSSIVQRSHVGSMLEMCYQSFIGYPNQALPFVVLLGLAK